MTASAPLRSRARVLLIVACAVGLTHAAFSLYWALGGSWLVETLGATMLSALGDRRWLLIPVVVVKTAVAVGPLVALRLGWWRRRPVLLLAAAAALVLIVWGGLNTVVGNLVLAGVIEPAGGFDRAAMVGHAWLWDPLFLTWGLALAGALAAQRSGGTIVP